MTTPHSLPQNQRSSPSRIAVPESLKHEIYSYALQHPTYSNGVILKWVRKTHRPTFPQSTLSTLLTRKSIYCVRKDGKPGRGRPPKKAQASQATTPKEKDNDSPLQSSPVASSPMDPELQTILTRLAPTRCRKSQSHNFDVELKILYEVYQVICGSKARLTSQWIRERTRALLKLKPNFKQKNLTLVLKLLEEKYYLTSMVYKCINSPAAFTYSDMLVTLRPYFPELEKATVPDVDIAAFVAEKAKRKTQSKAPQVEYEPPVHVKVEDVVAQIPRVFSDVHVPVNCADQYQPPSAVQTGMSFNDDHSYVARGAESYDLLSMSHEVIPYMSDLSTYELQVTPDVVPFMAPFNTNMEVDDQYSVVHDEQFGLAPTDDYSYAGSTHVEVKSHEVEANIPLNPLTEYAGNPNAMEQFDPTEQFAYNGSMLDISDASSLCSISRPASRLDEPSVMDSMCQPMGSLGESNDMWMPSHIDFTSDSMEWQQSMYMMPTTYLSAQSDWRPLQ